MSKARNTVLIITDTQPTRLLGCYGSTFSQSPQLDALAAQGMVFDRASTPCPLCTPARGALFTGIMPAQNGAYANELAPSRASPYMGSILAEAGDRTCYTGK